MIYHSPYPSVEVPETNVFDLVFGGLSEKDAALPAITELTTGTTATYAELRDYSESIAGELTSRGIGPGDVVTLQVPNSINFAASLLGVRNAVYGMQLNRLFAPRGWRRPRCPPARSTSRRPRRSPA